MTQEPAGIGETDPALRESYTYDEADPTCLAEVHIERTAASTTVSVSVGAGHELPGRLRDAVAAALGLKLASDTDVTEGRYKRVRTRAEWARFDMAEVLGRVGVGSAVRSPSEEIERAEEDDPSERSDRQAHTVPVAEAISDVMRRAGITQDQVATDLFWSPSKVIRLLKGDVYPNSSSFRALIMFVNEELARRSADELARLGLRVLSKEEIAELLAIYNEQRKMHRNRSKAD